MSNRMQSARPRARRSRHSAMARRRSGLGLVVVAAVLTIALVGGITYGVLRVNDFLTHTTGKGLFDPGGLPATIVGPPQGSIAYKLGNHQKVNILALGYGGPENDAPYLTDSIMSVTIDPVTKRIEMVSVPRDLVVDMTDLQDGTHGSFHSKINSAY